MFVIFCNFCDEYIQVLPLWDKFRTVHGQLQDISKTTENTTGQHWDKSWTTYEQLGEYRKLLWDIS